MVEVAAQAAAISSAARQKASAPAPLPPYSSGMCSPMRPWAPSRWICSAGYSSVSSTPRGERRDALPRDLARQVADGPLLVVRYQSVHHLSSHARMLTVGHGGRVICFAE